jgi:hypothetical protein
MAVTALAGPMQRRRLPLPRTAPRESAVTPLLVVALAVLAIVALLAGFPGPVRAVLVCAALLVVPGEWLVHSCRIADRTIRRALVVPVSLTVDVLVAVVIAGAHLWYPSGAAVVVLAVTAVAPLVRGVRAIAARRASGPRTPAPGPATRRRTRSARWTTAAAAGVLVLWALVAIRPLAAAAAGEPTGALLPTAFVRTLDRLGGTVPDIGALHRWPGLVAVAGFLSDAADVRVSASLLTVAATVLVLVEAVLAVALVRALGVRGPIVWVAGLVVTGTAGLAPAAAPRALGLTLLLAAVVVAVRCLRHVGPAAALRRAGSAVVFVLVIAAVAATDPLTSIAAAVVVGPFLLSGSMRPRWLVGAVVLAPVVALFPDVRRVDGHLTLAIGLGPETDPALGRTVTATTDPVLAIVVVVVLVGLAAIGAVRLVRAGRRSTAALAAWLAVAPVLAALMFGAGTVTAAAALGFALPFLAVGATLVLRPVDRSPFVPRAPRTPARRFGSARAAIALVVVATSIAAAGIAVRATPVPRTGPDVLAAATWLDARFRTGDSVVATEPMPVVVGPQVDRLLARPGAIVALPTPAPPAAAVYRTIAAHSGLGSTWVVFRDGHDATLRAAIAAVAAKRYDRGGIVVYELIYRD